MYRDHGDSDDDYSYCAITITITIIIIMIVDMVIGSTARRPEGSPLPEAPVNPFSKLHAAVT